MLFVDLSESFFLLDWKCKINGKRSYPRILEVFHDFMSILEAFHLSLLDFDPEVTSAVEVGVTTIISIAHVVGIIGL